MKETESLIILTPKREKRLDGTYYHLTTWPNFSEKIELYPRVPQSSSICESDIPRICVAPSVAQCLISICHRYLHNEFFIYKSNIEVHLPIGVPDAKVTGEVWCLNNKGVIFKRCGNIVTCNIDEVLGFEFKKTLKDAYTKCWTWMGVDLNKLEKYHLLIKEQLKKMGIENKP